MSGSTIIFYLLSILTLVSGILSVTTRQIFRAAIFLLFSLIGIAGLYFWMQYEFIAAVQAVEPMLWRQLAQVVIRLQLAALFRVFDGLEHEQS